MRIDAPVDGAEDAVEGPDQPFIAHTPVDGPMVKYCAARVDSRLMCEC